MTHHARHKGRATVGVALTALGFVTALAADSLPSALWAIVTGLLVFVTGLVLVETALFRALDDAFGEAVVHQPSSWAGAAGSR